MKTRENKQTREIEKEDKKEKHCQKKTKNNSK